jgi:peptide/nickel transport system substrate-binding protein
MTTPVLATGNIPGMELHAFAAADARGIAFPTLPKDSVKRDDGQPVGNDVTSDIAIRKAANIALDRQMLLNGVLNGYGAKAYTECDSLPWGSPDAAFKDNDIPGAIRILEEAGWVDVDGDGVREKNGLRAAFKVVYPSTDSTRQALAVAASDMLKPIGIEARPEGHSWDEIFTMLYDHPFVFGIGEMNPTVSYKQYSSNFAGMGTNNTMYYSNSVTDDYFARALRAVDQDEANDLWQKAQWDGVTGTSLNGESPMAWLVNLDHLYYINEKLDVGTQRIHGHGTTWQLARNIETWKWK